jgi:DNA-directed RNA polymerase specialized sigma24 family protein
LFTIAHRRGVDAIRRSVRDGELAVRAVDTVTVVAAADVEHDRIDSLDRAVALIASLPDQMGTAVMLRVVNELPVADVAAIMETTEGNVRVLVHRGILRLRRRILVTDDHVPTMKGVS